MKKSITCFILLIACAFLLYACGTSAVRVDNEDLAEEFENAPEWVLSGPAEGEVSAVGSATIGKAGDQFARNEALAQARSELAKQISLKVKDLFNNFTQQTGIGSEQTSDKMVKQITKQVTNETLSGSKLKEIWISPSKKMYVLVAIDSALVKQSVREGLRTSYQNDEARWQEFQAKNGNAELDREIEKTFGKSE